MADDTTAGADERAAMSGGEAAGRVRAWRNAWMANVKDNHVIMAWLGRASARDAPDDCPELTIADIDALLDERERLLADRAELETLRGQLGKPRETGDERDRAVWCWTRNPNGGLHCGRLAGHDGPHKRGEREWHDAEEGGEPT